MKQSWQHLSVMFVGDEPSSKNVDNNVAFVGTASYKRLLKWIGELDLDINKVELINLKDFEATRQRKTYPDKVIILGFKTNSKLWSEYGIATEYDDSIRVIDHPSYSNRNLNNPKYEKNMLTNLKHWLYNKGN